MQAASVAARRRPCRFIAMLPRWPCRKPSIPVRRPPASPGARRRLRASRRSRYGPRSSEIVGHLVEAALREHALRTPDVRQQVRAAVAILDCRDDALRARSARGSPITMMSTCWPMWMPRSLVSRSPNGTTTGRRPRPAGAPFTAARGRSSPVHGTDDRRALQVQLRGVERHLRGDGGFALFDARAAFLDLLARRGCRAAGCGRTRASLRERRALRVASASRSAARSA